MANVRITELQTENNPSAANDYVAIDAAGGSTRKTLLGTLMDALRPYANEAESLGEVLLNRVMSPRRSAELVHKMFNDRTSSVGRSLITKPDIAGMQAQLGIFADTVRSVQSLAALKAMTGMVDGQKFYLNGARFGAFTWRTGNFAFQVSIDPLEGCFVKATSVAITAGMFCRDEYFPVLPRWFGALVDGTTDDTAAITAADVFARAINSFVYFQTGTYMVSQLVVQAKSRWKGEKFATRIKQIIGSNKDLIYGVNSNANWGLAVPANTNYPHSFSIENFVLDGNWNGGPAYPGGTAGNTSGSGIAIYGDHCVLKDIYIKNCADHGIRTEMMADHDTSYDERFLEATYAFIRVDYVGKHGWVNKGPHDMVVTDCTVLDAGQMTDATYHGFLFQAGGSGRQIGIHAATRNGRRRMASAVTIEDGASHEFSGGCNIEGGQNANLVLLSSGCSFDPSTRFYAAWGGVNIYLGGNCKRNKVHGILQGPPAGRPACSGVAFGSGGADNVQDNDFDLHMTDQNAGFVAFTSRDLGGNTFKIRGYNTANVGITGTKNPLSSVDLKVKVNAGSNLKLDTTRQVKYLTIPANSSVVWIFDYPFPANPIIGALYYLPATAPNGLIWVSGIGTTSATIFNNSNTSQNIALVAHEQN